MRVRLRPNQIRNQLYRSPDELDLNQKYPRGSEIWQINYAARARERLTMLCSGP